MRDHSSTVQSPAPAPPPSPLLLQGLVFFLGREVPREQLLLVVRSFGGEAGWDGEGSPVQEGDERVTHQVRQSRQAGRQAGRLLRRGWP